MSASTTPGPAELTALGFTPACQAALLVPCAAPATHAMRCTACGNDRIGCAEHMSVQVHQLLVADDRNRALSCADCRAEGPALTLFDVVPLPGGSAS